jgi:uncharacterized protein (DUF2141 family)
MNTIAFALPLKLAGMRLATGAVLAAAAMSQAQAQTPTATLEVVVPQVRNTKGGVGCQLFAAAAGFPKDRGRALQAVMVPIGQGSARCQFQPVPAGTYAVAVVHDENGNQSLDSNFLGVPTEGYGVSNNRTYAMSEPRWDESRFDLAAGENRQLTIQLRY